MIKKILFAGIILFFTGIISDAGADPNSALTIYPNPVYEGSVQISSGVQMEKVEIMSIVGDIVYLEELEPSKSVRLNFDLKTGVYLIRVTYTDKKSETKKIWVN
jgi:hypothetical protein